MWGVVKKLYYYGILGMEAYYQVVEEFIIVAICGPYTYLKGLCS